MCRVMASTNNGCDADHDQYPRPSIDCRPYSLLLHAGRSSGIRLRRFVRILIHADVPRCSRRSRRRYRQSAKEPATRPKATAKLVIANTRFIS